MPVADDGSLTRLYTSQHGAVPPLVVEDPTPNMPATAGSSEPSFDLHLEGVAGNQLGGNGAPYTLTITASDLTAWAAAPGLNPPGGAAGISQSFDGSGAHKFWQQSSGANSEYVTNQVWTIGAPLPAGVSGHLFIYTASLVSQNNEQVWLIVSEPFVLC